MPWFSLSEAENYNTASAAWAQLLADPYNAPVYNSVQTAGPSVCGGGIDRYCSTNSDGVNVGDKSDLIALRDMSLQCYNRSIVWARNKDPADLAKTIEILEYWMVTPSTRMEPYLSPLSNIVEMFVFFPAFVAGYNIVKDQPGWTNQAAVLQWIVDFTASLYAHHQSGIVFTNKNDWLTAAILSGAIITGNTALFTTMRDWFFFMMNNRFEPDGRVKEDYLRNTGLSYTMFALEAMSLGAEMIFRETGENFFVHPGYRLALSYAAPYALNPGSWPWQQTTPYTLDQNRAYEFANTRDPGNSVYEQIIANATPFYVDTAGGHVTLTNSAASVLSLPAILSISVSTQNDGSGGVETVVSWSTDVPTTGTVTWGDSAAENSPAVSSPTLSTSHSVTLSPTTESVQYFFTISALTDLSVEVSFSQSNFIAEIDNPPGPGTYTDEFNTGTLDPQWLFTDPVGDSILTKLSSGVLISVPGGGAAHDAWAGGNNSARITHPIPDEDFYMEFKVDSAVTQRYQSQGFVVELDNTNFIRFDFYSDGSITNIHAGTIINNVAQNIILTAITANTTIYMRVKRTGNIWEQSYSYNGANWTVSGSFTQALGIVKAGLFAGNVGSSPIPAHTASFDYYRINQVPLPPPSGGGRPSRGGGLSSRNVIRRIKRRGR